MSVFRNRRSSEFWHNEQNFIRVRINPETHPQVLMAWCEQNIGRRRQDWYYRDCVEVFVIDPRKAVMLKLRFGGA